VDTELILSNISNHLVLTIEQEQYFLNLLNQKRVKKNEFILRQDQPCSHISFVNEGILRAYFLGANGKETTVMFAKQDWWITDMHCFLSEKPAMVSIQAIEEATVLCLSKTNLDKLYNELPQFNKFFRILMENAYSREQLRTIQNLSLTAIDRYNNFIEKYPEIAQKVPLKNIASYLGVTPEFLSTIRSRIS